MSEFQYYEFVAIDRPLNTDECRRLRAITSRATITSTRLVNTYEWGDFKGDPQELVAKYFDAFLYYASWGARRLILRVPSARLDLRVAKQYCCHRSDGKRSNRSVATVARTGENLVFDLCSAEEAADDWADTTCGVLSALVPIRNELMSGDYRALYLAWQLRARAGEVDHTARPRSAPVRMNPPTGSQQALAEFLRIDQIEVSDSGAEASRGA